MIGIDFVPNIKEFFAACNDPALTPKEQFALFKKLQPEYSKMSGSRELFRIMLSVDEGKYTLTDRLAAYDKYLEIVGGPADEQMEAVMRQIIKEHSEQFDEDK